MGTKSLWTENLRLNFTLTIDWKNEPGSQLFKVSGSGAGCVLSCLKRTRKSSHLIPLPKSWSVWMFISINGQRRLRDCPTRDCNTIQRLGQILLSFDSCQTQFAASLRGSIFCSRMRGADVGSELFVELALGMRSCLHQRQLRLLLSRERHRFGFFLVGVSNLHRLVIRRNSSKRPADNLSVSFRCLFYCVFIDKLQ